MTELTIPALSLVALVGVSGSGKSTFARRHFAATQVLSSDAFRAMVADDENDQSATAAAFDALHYVAGKRLAGGRLTVVDATNVQPNARAAIVALAREHDVLPVAIVLDVPEDECWARTNARPDRDFGRAVLARQTRDLRRSIKHLSREGFRTVHVLRGVDAVDGATVAYEKLYNDRTDLAGPFDIIGDVHGCRAELETLLDRLGWQIERDDTGRPVGARHPGGRTAVFVGDLVDRGPDSPGVLRLVMGMVAAGTALCVAGNHEAKLAKRLQGRKVRVAHGLAETLTQLDAQEPSFVADASAFLDGLISHYVLDGGRLVVAHAGIKEAYQGRASARVRAFCLYGDTTGETDEYGLPVRYPWANEYRGSAMVVYGHTPTTEPEWVNNTICIDTGCVFGGRLTALRYPERELVAVGAEREHFPPARPLAAAGGGVQRLDGTLDVADVLPLADGSGRKHLDTGYGRIAVDAGQAAAALEVMGRFALDPRWLLYLPPTMAPASTSAVDGYLEHPTEAFADYRKAGVTRLVCEEKHMGSRAVVLACRDAATARHRFGAADERAGVVYTRTGRPFFSADMLNRALVDRVSGAVNAAGLWAELNTDWLLLDAELLPWSAKATELIQDQYASVGTAARAALPAAVEVLDAAARRGLDVAEIRERFAVRADNAVRFTDAYRRYVRPTDGLNGVTLAPFAVLATERTNHAGRDHGWHLAIADRLVAADPALFSPTARRIVHLDEPAAVADAIAWWTALTNAGGEGMVVKPYDGLVRDSRGGLVQPGLKCRGREYLRIIYGPDYTEPARLDRLRQRNLARKRSLALREYALGLAALNRAAAGEPLWRIHELVFAVLALESDPVDPRL
jgi:protein phosphatase